MTYRAPVEMLWVQCTPQTYSSWSRDLYGGEKIAEKTFGSPPYWKTKCHKNLTCQKNGIAAERVYLSYCAITIFGNVNIAAPINTSFRWVLGGYRNQYLWGCKGSKGCNHRDPQRLVIRAPKGFDWIDDLNFSSRFTQFVILVWSWFKHLSNNFIVIHV